MGQKSTIGVIVKISKVMDINFKTIQEIAKESKTSWDSVNKYIPFLVFIKNVEMNYTNKGHRVFRKNPKLWDNTDVKLMELQAITKGD